MPINLEEGKKILTETIQKTIRHRDYKRTTDIAKQYTAFVTGEDVGALLKQFTPREPDEEFTQRKELTQVITDYMAYRLMTPMFKVGKLSANKGMSWKEKEKSDDNKRKLQNFLDLFAGDESVDDYLSTAMVLLDSTDPNAFIVTELDGTFDPNSSSKDKPIPYPFEVSSEEAINYKKINNILQFLVVLNVVENMKRYTIYLQDDTIVAQQISLDDYKNATFAGAEILFKDPEKKEADEIYVVTFVSHKLGKIPAIQIGTRKDTTTRNRTYVPMIHPARAFFLKSIKTISEYDLTQALHVFPQKITYDHVCGGHPEQNIICHGGLLPTGEKCPICKGSGFLEHKSAQNILRVKMPNELKDVVSLENFIAYKHPSTEILEFMKKLGLYEYPDLAIKAVYSSELFTSDNITTTATEKNIDLESVYDALKPFANKWSSVWRHVVQTVATYTNLGKDLELTHQFPKDFKMKPLTMLLEDLHKANDSGSPSYIKKEINRDIAQKLYIDKPEEILKIDVKEKFFPFNGKTESEISTIILSGLTSKYNQVLYANFEQIFDELEQENTTDAVNFYRMELGVQKAKLKTKVEQYMAEISSEQAIDRSLEFGINSEIDENSEGGGDLESEAQAKLKGTVGGVKGILDLKDSLSKGITDRSSAITLLMEIYGFDNPTASRILGKIGKPEEPKKEIETE